MNYRDFSVKSKLIISLFQIVKFRFHCFKNSFFVKKSRLFYWLVASRCTVLYRHLCPNMSGNVYFCDLKSLNRVVSTLY